MKKPILLASWIMCPDGTMLPSFNRHDFREHMTIDKIVKEHPEGAEEPDDMSTKEWRVWMRELVSVVKESRYSAIDGGTDYLRRMGVSAEMSVYSDDPYEVIRRFVCRGGRGKDSTEHLTWTPLFRINDEWLDALITYEIGRGGKNPYLKYYRKERKYRKTRNIIIK